MSSNDGKKQSSATTSTTSKPRLEFENRAEELHSYEQVKIHSVLEPGGDNTAPPSSGAALNPPGSDIRHSQHKYDAVVFDENEQQPTSDKTPPNTMYEVPRPVDANQPDSSVYNVPGPIKPAPPSDQYQALGNRNASSEYKEPVRRKKKHWFGKKTESRTHITQNDEDEEPDYEEGKPEKKSSTILSGLNVTGCVRIVLLCVAIGVLALALVISFISIGVSSSRSCNCPSQLLDNSMFDLNCTTSSVFTCDIAQSSVVGEPARCLTTAAVVSTFNSFTSFECSVNPNGEQRPVTTSMVYEDASQNVRCLCSIVVGNETQVSSSNVECVLMATECSVVVVNRRK